MSYHAPHFRSFQNPAPPGFSDPLTKLYHKPGSKVIKCRTRPSLDAYDSVSVSPWPRTLFFVVCGRSGAGIERVVEFNLLCQGELSAATAFTVQTETAAIIRTPLAKGAIGTRVLFGGVLIHRGTRFRLTAAPSSNRVNALSVSAQKAGQTAQNK
jgi:hypothetical protein